MNQERLRQLKDSLPIRAFAPAPVSKGRSFWQRPKRAKDLPIVVTGAVGDNILAIRLIKEIEKRVGTVSVYSDYPEVLAAWGRIDAHPAKTLGVGFDYTLWLNSVPRFGTEKSFRGFVNDSIGDLYMTTKSNEGDREWGPYIARHPYLDNSMARAAVAKGLNRETLPYSLLGIPYPKPWRVLPHAYQSARYITIHDGYETTLGTMKRATKTWSLDAWTRFVKEFKAANPGILVIQLGGATSRSIPGVDASYVGKLSLKRSFEILSCADFHVDGDSGLVHAARMFGVRSIVMFGPTDLDFFGYPENVNLGPKECGGCWWLTRDWMQNCAAGEATPRCMDSITPSEVLEACERVLDENAR